MSEHPGNSKAAVATREPQFSRVVREAPRGQGQVDGFDDPACLWQP